MKSKSIRWVFTNACLLLALSVTATGAGFAADADHDSDSATLRRQAMYEWYTDDYSHHGEEGFANQKQMYFPMEYARFLNEIARRERIRFSALLPGASKTNDPAQALTTGTWTNIGPDRANFALNGVTLNVSDSGRANVILTDPNNTSVIYVGFSGGGVWKSTDGGNTWNPKTETLGSLSVGSLAMDPSNSNTLYLGLGDPFDGTGIGLVKSIDGGDTWSNPVYLGNSSIIPDIKVAPNNPQIVLAATDAGLYRSTDGGASFTKVSIATGQAADPYVWTLAWGSGNVFVVGLEAAYANFGSGTSTLGQIWRSTDNGATWTQSSGVTNFNGATDNGVGRLYIASAPSDRNVMYAEAANKNEGIATADFADIFKSTDNGVTWTGMAKTVPNGGTYKQYTTTNSESTRLGTLLNGQGWYNELVLVDPTNPNVAYFGGALLLARTIDGGTTFSQVSNWLAQFSLPYVHADFHGGTIASDGTLYVGTDGGIFRSSNAASAASGGTVPTFTDTLNKGIASHLIYQLGSSSNSTSAVVIGLQDNGTRVRVGSTSTFNQIIGGDGFGCDLNQSDSTKMLGSLYYDRIYRSTNSGASFTAACSGITECNNSSTAPFITVLSRWAGDNTGNTVFTFSNTKVYKTVNYATSWTALGVSGLPTSSFAIRGVGAAKADANIVGVVANSGRAYLTTNGGTSWTQIGNSNPSGTGSLPGNGLSLSSIKFDPTNASIVYITSVAASLTATHIWRSTNSGTSWAAIDGAASGFPAGVPVNALFIDPVTPTTLYAATMLGVYISSDSGGNWTRYGAGMPLVNVTDLYLASDDSLIRAATFGRSVWEYSPAPTQYTLAYTTDGHGTINGTPSQTVNSGASGTAVTAMPNAGYHFVKWNDNSTANPRTDTNVQGSISVQALFAANVLVFTTQPSNLVQRSALGSIAVAEQDGGGNTMSDTATVDFTMTTVCGALDLGSVVMTNGVATLNSAQAFNTASNYQITATVTNPNPTPIVAAQSSTFAVTQSPDFIFINGFEVCTP